MDKGYEQEYKNIEQYHPWFVARRELIYNIIRNTRKDAKIIDVGCGTGITSDYLQKRGFKNVCGIDNSVNFIEYNKEGFILGDVLKLPLKSNFFDVVLCLDVIEHLENDKAVANELYRILSKDGCLVVTVPAFQFLWSNHDVVNHHYCRYNAKKLKELFKSMKVVKISYWNFSLFLPALILKLFPRKSEKNHNFIKLPKFFDYLIFSILKLENLLFTWFNLPFGTSLIIILKKSN